MVSQLRSQTARRRVTRSQSGVLKPRQAQSTTKPQPRYADSSTASEEEGMSDEPELIGMSSHPKLMESSVATTSMLTERLFACNCYPSKPRLNIYSKATIIGALVKSLRGTPELNTLLGSQFGALFQFPVSRCPNSAKLLHSLFGRQLVTSLRYELWFLFADTPIRFSLYEFCDITGLKSDPYVEKGGKRPQCGDVTSGGPMWKELFETEDVDVTVLEVLGMLAQPGLPDSKIGPIQKSGLIEFGLA